VALHWKVLIGGLLSLLVIGSVFGWHIHTVYRQVIASTNLGAALFESDVLKAYGETITKHLKNNKVKAAIVSRSGQPRKKLPEGVIFTHSAFFLYEPETDNYAVYNLYHGEKNRLKSSLVKDTPADFLRLLREHDAGLIIPTPEFQEALYDYIISVKYSEVHQSDYSLISNPYDPRFQNCNEYMLDSLAALIWDTNDVGEIKSRFKDTLRPSELKASFIRRHIGPIVDERLVMDDHSDKIWTTTSQTLANFLADEGKLENHYMIDLDTGAQHPMQTLAEKR